MQEINYEKVLNKLVSEYPHEIGKIKEVIIDARKTKYYCSLSIDFQIIIDSSEWNALEKCELLRFFGYNKNRQKIRKDNGHGIEEVTDAIKYTIINNNLSGFEALMMTFYDIKSYKDIDKDFKEILDLIIRICKEEEILKFFLVALNSLNEEDKNRLIMERYQGNNLVNVHNTSIMTHIIATKNLELVSKYLRYVKDINVYLNDAVKTGKTAIVKFFLDNGANINYLNENPVIGKLTPLKTAIVNNDYEMVKFLISNGALVNKKIEEDTVEKIKHSNVSVYHNHYQTFNVLDNCETIQKIEFIRKSTPLEFAIMKLY